MNIAICGMSCTGKSMLGKLLANYLNCELRNCGSIVLKVAARLKLPPEQLSLNEHAKVDAETIEFISQHSKLQRIVEGRYIDQVIVRCDAPIVLVELVSSEEARLARWGKRAARALKLNWLRSVDEADFAFRRKAYAGIEQRPPSLTIDTSRLGPADCMNVLITSLKLASG